MKINEAGRSMIEMLGVLAIIGVLSVGGIAGYTKAMNKYRTNKVIDELTMIVTNIRTLYAMQRNYNGLNEVNALDMGVIPDELGTTSDALETGNPFGGGVYISSATRSTRDGSAGTFSGDRAFIVNFTGLPREACVALATGDWGSGHSAGLIAVGAYPDEKTGDAMGDDGVMNDTSPCSGNDPNVSCAGIDTTDGGTPMMVTKAAKACTCGTESVCTVIWKYF